MRVKSRWLRKLFGSCPRKPHKFTKAVLTLNLILIGRTKLLFLFMQVNFHNTLQCWEISLANVQENRTPELAFKILEFPKGRKDRVLDARGQKYPRRNAASLMHIHQGKRVSSL